MLENVERLLQSPFDQRRIEVERSKIKPVKDDKYKDDTTEQLENQPKKDHNGKSPSPSMDIVPPVDNNSTSTKIQSMQSIDQNYTLTTTDENTLSKEEAEKKKEEKGKKKKKKTPA